MFGIGESPQVLHPVGKTSLAIPGQGFHFQFDQAIEFHRVFHGQFLDEGFDEPVDDHHAGLVLVQTPALQVEQLLFGDLGDAGLVLDPHVVLGHIHGGIGVAAGLMSDEQGVALHVGLAAVGPADNLDQAAVAGTPVVLADGFRDDPAGGICRGVDHLGAGVLVLAMAGEGDRQYLAVRSFPLKDDGRILHGELGADVAVHPLHHGPVWSRD